MSIKRTITPLFFSVFLISNALFALDAGEVSVTGVEWRQRENLLAYNLSEDCRVKIRVGSYAGPVYRTLVNLDERHKGENRESWNGKDEAGSIDFFKYGKPHFCVGVPVKQDMDYPLDVKFSGKEIFDDKITVDVPEAAKALFNKYGGELRLYVDNKLQKAETVKTLPHTLTLEKEKIPEGSHLVVLNLWTALDYNAVAYKTFEISVEKRAPQQVIKSEAPTPSRGKNNIKSMIVFSMPDKNGIWQLFTSGIDGADTKQLTSSPADKRYPSWSPDGQRIVYANSSGELRMIDRNGNNDKKIPLPINCSAPGFSPDGKNIIFTCQEDIYHGSSKIWEVDLKDLRMKKLVNRPWLQYNPAYSPDGKFIIFTDGPELFGQNILKLNRETGDITQLTDNGPYDYDIQGVFLNSGLEIIYSTNEGGGNYQIYRMDKFGRNKINLSMNPKSHDIMPRATKDDGKIFFLSDRSGISQIWQMNMDGSDPKQITQSGSGINSFSAYSE